MGSAWAPNQESFPRVLNLATGMVFVAHQTKERQLPVAEIRAENL